MRTLPLLFLLFLTATGVSAPTALEIGPGEKEQLPRGKEADGIVGDFILRNDKVTAVISGNLPLRRANMSTFYGEGGITPGCLYDLALSGANDQLTIFAPTEQQGPVSWVRVAKDGKDGEAAIECVATAPNRDGVARHHVYSIRDGWQGVLVTSTITNESAVPKKVQVGDKWTTFWRTGVAPLGAGIMWAEAVDPADRAGYAVGYTEAPADIATLKLRDLNPGESLTFSRFVAVGESPLEAVGLVAEKQGAVRQVSGVVKDTAGATVAGASLIIRPAAAVSAPRTGETPKTATAASAAAATPAEAITPATGAAATTPAATGAAARLAVRTSRAIGIGYTDAQGRFTLRLPPGDFDVTFSDAGRPDVQKSFTTRTDGDADDLNVEMAAAAAVKFNIRDEAGISLPCKAQFNAIEGTERPNLGPDQRAHGCRDQYHSERGDFRVAIPPGKYRVVVTRGIEYSHLAQDVELKGGETFDFTGTLKRLVDTSGWVSADYHNHSTPSGDNTCGTDDRIINLVAEHIEFAPTTEHNRLYDWAPHIERLGLSSFIQTVAGLELTGGGAHFNSFPFKPVPLTQDNGAPVWNKDPRITAITLRDWQGAEPDRWIQINHPDMVANFTDANADGLPDGGFHGLATLIDGIETQNYQASELLGDRPYRITRDAKTLKETVGYLREYIWLQLLNRGHRYAAMAVCDAHSVFGNGVGGWRMYMPSASDEPAKIDWRENSRAAKAGHSYLTTGPFLQVTTDDGTGPGGQARTLNGAVQLRVRVQCTDWLDIDRVQVLVNSRAVPALNFTRAKDADKFKDGVVKFDETLTVPLSEDAHIIVVACAETSDLRIGYGSSSQSKVRPFAYHNPIFVDVDGHGFTPNGDLLGWPLPVKKLNVEEAKRMLLQRNMDAEAPDPATEL